MANEFKVKNGLIVIGDLTTSGTITINGALAATQSWVTSQSYLTSASLSGYATQSYVTSAISALIDAAPAALDTLNELAAALGDDASFSTTVTNSIAGKVAKSGDTMTGSLTFASTADNVRIQKNSSFLNLRDPYNNIHLYNAGDGTYIDANVHHWRSQGASYWMTLNGTGLGIGTTSPNKQLTFAQANDDAIQIRRLTTSQGNTSLGTGISWTWTSAGTDNETWAAIRVIMPGNSNSIMTFSTTPDNGAAGLTERMRITDTGNVGIGTSTPSQKFVVSNGSSEVFKVYGGGEVVAGTNYIYAAYSSGTSFYAQGPASFRNGIHNDTNTYLKIDGGTSGFTYFSGNVGIGTTSPGAKIHVVPTGTQIGVIVDGTSVTADTANKVLDVLYNGGSSAFSVRSNGIVYIGYDYLYVEGAGITRRYYDSRIQFGTADLSSSTTGANVEVYGGLKVFKNVSNSSTSEIFRITNGGNVGIGTTSPESKLHVAGGPITLKGGSSTDQQIVFNYAREYVQGIYNGSGHFRLQDNSLGGTVYQWDGSTFAFPNGNVGIGTSSPSEKLHVSGAAIFDGGAGNSSTDAVVYITKSTNDDWGLYVNNAGLDYGMYTRTSPSANYAFAIHNGTTWTTRITGNAIIYLGEKDAIRGNSDSWLRLNNSNDYTSGVYTPGVMRADGGFNVSGSTVWHAGNDGSGSGLDADTLDGLHASSFLLSNFGNVEGEHSFGYPSSDGWYKIAEVVLNGTCQSYNLWGEYRDTGYFDNSHYRIHITARAECDFPTNNESHAINVNIYGSSTNETYFTNNVRVILTSSSSNYRKYELQYYRATWDTGSWRLQTIGWTTYATSQTAGTSTGTPRVYYISKFVADNIYAANKISIGTSYSGFAANIAGTTYIIGASAWVNDAYGYVNASSPGTGFFPYSDGNSVIASSNTTRLFVNGSTGNIGIGTSSPSTKLEVNGGATGNNIARFTTGGAGGGTRGLTMYSDNSQVKLQVSDNVGGIGSWAFLNLNPDGGNVGIGTTAPDEKLQVAGNIKIQNETGLITDYGPLVGRYNTSQVYVGTGGNYSIVKIGRADGGALNVLSGGDVGIGSTTTSGYKLYVNGSTWINGGTNFTDGVSIFRTQSGAAEVMRIASNSNVGIGINSPQTKLDVFGVDNAPALRLSFPSGNTLNAYTGIVFSGETAKAGILFASNAAGYARGSLIFATSNSNDYTGINLTHEKMRITDSGNVGIGTTSPSYKLDVVLASTSDAFRIQQGGNSKFVLNGDGVMTWGGSANAGVLTWDSSIAYMGGSGGNALGLYTNGNEKVRITTGGNVGIGTTSPNYKLDVAGFINIFTGNGLRWGSGDAEIINSGYNLLLKTYNGSALAEAMRINSAGKVSIGTTDTNSDKSDFTVYTGGNTSIALAGNLFRVGESDINWDIALRQNGVLQTYAQNLYLNTVAGNYPVVMQPNGTSSVEFYQDYTLFNGLNLSISRVNSAHASNYFRGDSSHLVIGTGGTLYLNYGGSTTNITGNVTITGGIGQNNLVGRPYAVWGASGATTGAVVIKFPGNTSNYGMVHAVIDIYEYSGNHVSTVIVGGHNWGGSQWYNYGANLVGQTDKQVRVAIVDGAYAIVIGDNSSSWSYGQVVLRKIQNGSYYANAMNVSEGYTITQTASLSPAWISGDLRQLTVSGVVTASGGNSNNWNTAYSWGNHGTAGYLTSETDTLQSVTSRGTSTNTTLTSTNTLGLNVNSGSHSYININSTSNWSWVRLSNNGSTRWDIASYDGDALQFRPYGSGDNAMYLNLDGSLFINSLNDGKLNLRVPSGDSSDWNYINFIGSNGVRDTYFGTDSGGTPTWWRDDNGVNITLGSSVLINGNTAWHAGNDGSGSGLDADTVDGVQADSIVYGNARGTNDSVTTNNNDLDKTGYYTSDSFATKPSGVANWMYIEHIKLYNANTAYQKQLGYDTYDDRMWVRTKSGGAWSSWKQIWTSDSLTNLSQLTNGPGYITSSALSGYATTSYVTTQINNLINGAPGALDTLDELAAALGDDANFATTVTNSIASKLSLSGGTMTGQILFQTSALNNGFRWDVNSDAAGITFKNTGDGDNNSYFNFFTEDNGNEYFKFSHNTWNIGSFDFMDVKNGVVRTNGNIYVNASQSGSRSAGTNELINGNRVWHDGDFSSSNISNWNTAYGWGDHSSVGYALNSSLANYLPLSGGVIGGAVTINGNLTVNGTITENSSIKLKENIETSEGNLEKVVNLRPVTYNKIGSQTTELGLIAEEVAEVYPEFVQYDENGEPVGVHYSRLTAALIGAVKELTNQVQELNKKING